MKNLENTLRSIVREVIDMTNVDPKMINRAKMLVAMEYIARHVNDEEAFYNVWLTNGIADGDIKIGSLDIDIEELDYYLDADVFKDMMTTFLELMAEAWECGGLYCGEVVSADKHDFEEEGCYNETDRS